MTIAVPVAASIRRTCCACPSQWEGMTTDGRWFYIRYRWGGLELGIDRDFWAAVENAHEVYESHDPWHGEMTDDEMVNYVGGHLVIGKDIPLSPPSPEFESTNQPPDTRDQPEGA